MRLPESLARAILQAALNEDRAAELLECLFEGGSATVDRSGKLILASGSQLAGLMDDE